MNEGQKNDGKILKRSVISIIGCIRQKSSAPLDSKCFHNNAGHELAKRELPDEWHYKIEVDEWMVMYHMQMKWNIETNEWRKMDFSWKSS